MSDDDIVNRVLAAEVELNDALRQARSAGIVCDIDLLEIADIQSKYPVKVINASLFRLLRKGAV